MKVKPRKITHALCVNCGRHVKFRLDWEGVASPTRKDIIHYKELYATCPKCDTLLYVPAVNDINVARRLRAYENLPEITRAEVQGSIDDLIKMFENKEES